MNMIYTTGKTEKSVRSKVEPYHQSTSAAGIQEQKVTNIKKYKHLL